MSNKLFSEVVKHPQARGATHAVLMVLADMANEKGECWPSFETIAHRASVSRMSSIRAIAWLKDHGFLTVTRRLHPGSGRTSNLYQVRVPCQDSSSQEVGTDAVPLPDPRPAQEGLQESDCDGSNVIPGLVTTCDSGSTRVIPGPVTTCDSGSNKVIPKSLINPQINQPPPEEGPLQENIFRLYEQNFGVITPLIADTLKDAEKTYPHFWIEQAMRLCVQNNIRKWSYCEKILNRWQRDGFGVDGRKKNPRQRPYPVRTEGQSFGDRMLHWAENQQE